MINGTNFFNGSTVDIALTDNSGRAVLVRCAVASIPSAASGYAVGCLLQATDTGGIYTNTGTVTSSTFTLLEDAGGSFTLPTSATDGTSTTTNSFALTGSALTTGDLFSGTGAAQTTGGIFVGTSPSSNVIAVGRQGKTSPAFQVDASAATSVTGLKVTAAAAAGGVALAAISSGTDESLTLNAKGAGLTSIGGVSTGLVKIGQGSAKQIIQGGTVTALGATQNSTPTAAQLLGGIVTQQSQTGGGTITTPTGANISAAISGVAAGDSFRVRFANIGNQTLTVTAGDGNVTVVGTATIATLTNADLMFVNTGTNTWVVYTNK